MSKNKTGKRGLKIGKECQYSSRQEIKIALEGRWEHENV